MRIDKSILKCLALCIMAPAFLLLGCSGTQQSHVEYGVFYVETQGEFVVPVGADAPAIYSWSSLGQFEKGDLDYIWDKMGITEDLGYSFSYVEISVLNHLAKDGWQLDILEISSTSTADGDIRTAYRYIFKRNRV